MQSNESYTCCFKLHLHAMLHMLETKTEHASRCQHYVCACAVAAQPAPISSSNSYFGVNAVMIITAMVPLVLAMILLFCFPMSVLAFCARVSSLSTK